MSSFCESRQHSIILGVSFFSFQGTYLLLKACNLRFTICYLGFQDFFFFFKSPAAPVQSNCNLLRTMFPVNLGGYLSKEPFFSHPNSTHNWLEGFKQLLEYLRIKRNSVSIQIMLFCKMVYNCCLVCLFSDMVYSCSLQ